MQEITIRPGQSEKNYWRNLWRYRELFYTLAWRDVAVRYKQTVIGIAWSILQPLVTMLILSIVFGVFLRIESAAPYPILVFAAILPWQFFSTSLSDCSNSLIANAPLISKVYFPRLIIPTSTVIVSLVDFAISALLLVLMITGFHIFDPSYQFVVSWKLLALPGLIALTFAASVGAGLWFGALNVKYRDFRYVVPTVILFGMYASPVAYSSTLVPEKWRLLYSCNPMAGVIDGFRWSLIGGEETLYLPGLCFSIGLVAILLTTGIWYFRRTEKKFADVV